MDDKEKKMQRALGTYIEKASADDVIHALGNYYGKLDYAPEKHKFILTDKRTEVEKIVPSIIVFALWEDSMVYGYRENNRREIALHEARSRYKYNMLGALYFIHTVGCTCQAEKINKRKDMSTASTTWFQKCMEWIRCE